MAEEHISPSRPLAVDLDGTLIKTDSLLEACAALWCAEPFAFVRLLFSSVFSSAAAFKWALFSRVDLQTLEVPFSEALLEWLRAQKASGRSLLLVSATPQFWVERLAARAAEAGLRFDESIGSTPVENRRGKGKAAYLVKRFGRGGFDYVGNSQADMAVWAAAGTAYNVNPSRRLAEFARKRKIELLQIASQEQSPFMERWDEFLRMRSGLALSAFAGMLTGLVGWAAWTGWGLFL